MKTVTTSRCRRFGHREFRIEYDAREVLSIDAERFAESLEEMVARGGKFLPDETIQIGWSLGMIAVSDTECLSFLEPDMSDFPITWQIGLTRTLSHLRLHKNVVESFEPSLALDLPSLLQSCLICDRVSESEDFMMSRWPPSENDSGWFVGCLLEHDHQEPNHLQRISLYQAVVGEARGCLPFLALPAGTNLVVERGAMSFFDADANRLRMRPGSFLAEYSAGKDQST